MYNVSSFKKKTSADDPAAAALFICSFSSTEKTLKDKLQVRISHVSQTKYSMQSARFLLSLWIKSIKTLCGVLFSSELCFTMSIPSTFSIMCLMNRHRALLSPCHSLLLCHCIFIFIAKSIFVTTAVFSNFYSTNWSQSPFNGISINLLNGFKNSLALMWVSKILMWTLKICSRCAQFDRISSVSARLSPNS